MNYELGIMNRGKSRQNDSAASRPPRRTGRGFTLIELLISIAIFTIITSLIMVSQSRFGVNITVTNLAYDVALGIRQAQVYGVSVKNSSAGFNQSYGIHFSLSNPGYFVLFADTNDDKVYNTGDNGSSCTSGECVSFFKVERGNSISGLCANGSCVVSSLDILFHRPYPEPLVNGSTGSASVTVTSAQGGSKTVTIYSSGQVSVQ